MQGSTMRVLAPLVLLVLLLSSTSTLSPRESESREIFSLDGLWDFLEEPAADPDVGIREQWFNKQISRLEGARVMPVPSSYNDVTQDASLRDHVGVVWYQRCMLLPSRFTDQSRRIMLHFASVHYSAVVWLNGQRVAKHDGGHLPFEAHVSAELARSGREACITVSVNNSLTPRTIPQGRLVRPNDTSMYPRGYVKQTFEFDFFNFAGIQRSVCLYTTPHSYVHDVTLSTAIEFRERGEIVGIVNYVLQFRGPSVRNDDFYHNVILRDEDGTEVANNMFSQGDSGRLVVHSPRLWWPFLSRRQQRFTHLYTFEIQLIPNNNVLAMDMYRINVGIRSLTWNHGSIFINGKPFYFRGFGRHEDADVRGRGVDAVLAWHDGYLLQWLGANSYRTSHYPYSEESLDVADRMGFVVIAETPAVGLKSFSSNMLRRHQASLRELVARDKNRPSVVMWSLANEPLSQLAPADLYFRTLAESAAKLDPTRPITFVTSQQWSNDVAVQHVDVVCFNRYAGWYGDGGRLDLVKLQTEAEAGRWHDRFAKPVIVAEYGAGAIAGLHVQPSAIWTEDYQSSIFYKHFEAFDSLQAKGFFIGEMVWNFADFATPQEVIRPTGCLKGVVTRNRRPKQGAQVIRERYWGLAAKHCRQALHLNISGDKSQEDVNCDIQQDKKFLS